MNIYTTHITDASGGIHPCLDTIITDTAPQALTIARERYALGIYLPSLTVTNINDAQDTATWPAE